MANESNHLDRLHALLEAQGAVRTNDTILWDDSVRSYLAKLSNGALVVYGLTPEQVAMATIGAEGCPMAACGAMRCDGEACGCADAGSGEYDQYRITFYDSAELRIDTYQFAWLLSRYGIEIVAKPDGTPALIVRAPTRGALGAFCAEVNHVAGPLFFRSVEGAGPRGYEELDEL